MFLPTLPLGVGFEGRGKQRGAILYRSVVSLKSCYAPYIPFRVGFEGKGTDGRGRQGGSNTIPFCSVPCHVSSLTS